MSQPDFSLINHYPETHYLDSSNIPSLLANLPEQDWFAYSSSSLQLSEPAAAQDNIPAWDSLWQGATRLSIATVPEPSALALLGLGALLLGARRPRPRQ